MPSGKERQVQMLAWPQLANTKKSSSNSSSWTWTAAQRYSLCSLLGHGPLHFTSLEDHCKDRKCQHIIFVTKKQNVNHRKNREYYGFCKSKEESRKNNRLRSREGEAGDHFLTKDPNEAASRLCPAGSTWGVLELGTDNLGLVDNLPPRSPPFFCEKVPGMEFHFK